MIEVEDVSFSYDEASVLSDVKVLIKDEEFIGIFGPNGGGKTTFLKLLMGFLKPEKGKIRSNHKNIGYVPQVANFDKQFPISVFEVVLGGCIHLLGWGFFSSRERKKAQEMIARVGLQGLENRPFGTLSGGQAQRALIARALVSDPDLLLLDEPTANIDGEAEEVIFRILMELKGEITILMVTHDLQAVLGRVDRLLCIQHTVSSFSPAEVCDHFAVGLYHPPIKGPKIN